MNKLITGLCIFIFSIQMGTAQPAQLMVKQDIKGLHLDHNVAAKEGLYSIARLYNVHPKALAAYNNLDMSKGLSIGQLVLVPLTDTNFTQKNNKGIPIYHKVGDKEGLMKVSSANNKVSIQNLRTWNKLSKDDLTPGSKLVIGFLVTNETIATATVKDEPVKKTDDKPLVTPEKSIVKEEQEKKTDDKAAIKTEPVAAKTNVKEDPKKAVVKQEVTTNMSGQGYFKPSFDQQVKSHPVSKTQTVTSGIFKTTSGFEDAKFYLLIDGVASGTIVRIINPENNKAIYAKVLGEMNGIRQNQGLDIRMSNASASILGISDMDKFIVKINY